jgi:hypothetical protein
VDGPALSAARHEGRERHIPLGALCFLCSFDVSSTSVWSTAGADSASYLRRVLFYFSTVCFSMSKRLNYHR